MTIAEEYMLRTKMVDKNNSKKGVKEIVDYLTTAECVNKLIIATELGLPVLTLVASDLEKKFGADSDFPVVKVGDNYNATNRQNVGRIIKFVMTKYGYAPVAGKLDPQCRIPAAMNAEHFSTSALYKKNEEIIPEYEIKVESVRKED